MNYTKQENKPIRILHCTSKLSHGGVQSFLLNYAKYIDNDEVVFDYVVQSPQKYEFEENVCSKGSKVFHVTSLQKSKLQYMKELYSILKEHPEYKIVNAHLNYSNIFPLLAAFIARVPIRISHSHNNYKATNWVKKVLRLFGKNCICIFSTQCWACSREAGIWLYGKRMINNNKFKIIHNAIDLKKYKFNKEIRNKLCQEYKLEDYRVWVHVGMFGVSKNHNFLIDLFYHYLKQYENTFLILCGDGELKQNIKSKVIDYKIEKNVIFTGTVDNINEYFMLADMFPFPSLNEGFPLTCIEAQASGCPCVVSVAVPDEALINSNAVKCNSFDVEEWITEIKKLEGKRIDCNLAQNAINTAGYDIVIEGKKLQLLYTHLYKEILN